MTRIVTCAADAANLDILVIDNFLDADECDRLAAIYRDSEGHYETWHTDAFWKGRLLGHRDVLSHNANQDMRSALQDARFWVRRFYGETARFYVDALHLVGWPTGWSMSPHADNAHESGEQHEFHWRDYSGVLYLNDDFEGGDLYLPKQDVSIRPRRGMFVSLPCGLSHMHGVTEIKSGLRITMAFFLTRELARADRSLLEEDAA